MRYPNPLILILLLISTIVTTNAYAYVSTDYAIKDRDEARYKTCEGANTTSPLTACRYDSILAACEDRGWTHAGAPNGNCLYTSGGQTGWEAVQLSSLECDNGTMDGAVCTCDAEYTDTGNSCEPYDDGGDGGDGGGDDCESGIQTRRRYPRLSGCNFAVDPQGQNCQIRYPAPSFDCVDGCQYDPAPPFNSKCFHYPELGAKDTTGYCESDFESTGQACTSVTVSSASSPSSNPIGDDNSNPSTDGYTHNGSDAGSGSNGGGDGGTGGGDGGTGGGDGGTGGGDGGDGGDGGGGEECTGVVCEAGWTCKNGELQVFTCNGGPTYCASQKTQATEKCNQQGSGNSAGNDTNVVGGGGNGNGSEPCPDCATESTQLANNRALTEINEKLSNSTEVNSEIDSFADTTEEDFADLILNSTPIGDLQNANISGTGECPTLSFEGVHYTVAGHSFGIDGFVMNAHCAFAEEVKPMIHTVVNVLYTIGAIFILLG